MLVTVRVTKKHIECGDRNMSGSCPIARAVRDLLCNAYAYAPYGVAMRAHRFEWFLDSTYRNWPPEHVQDITKFTIDFDHGSPVEPFEFNLDIPARYLKENIRAKTQGPSHIEAHRAG